MTWLTRPEAFNVLIIVLFICAAIRWGFAGNWPQCGYWLSAALLNICITMMGGK